MYMYVCVRGLETMCTLVVFLGPCDSVGDPPNEVVEVLATISCCPVA